MTTIEASDALEWAARVNAIRSTGMTQTELAKQLRVSPATVSLWEKGEHVPQTASMKRIQRLEKQLGTTDGGRPDRDNFAAELQRVRREHGLTQEELATHLGVPKHSIVRWERGERKPQEGTLRRLESYLKQPMNGNKEKGYTITPMGAPVVDIMGHLQEALDDLPLRDVAAVSEESLDQLIGTLTELQTKRVQLRELEETSWRDVVLD